MTYTIKVCVFALFLHSLQCTPTERMPTERPAPNYDGDAITLKKAMEGFGSDKPTIVDLLVKRSNAQRQEIKKAFITRYGTDLVDELKSELEGNLENAVVALMLPNNMFYAKELRDAFVGLGTDDKAVAEILGALEHNVEIRDIANVYQKQYGTTLKDDLITETSGSFQNLVVALSKADRREDGKVDQISAITDANELIKATEKHSETNDTAFINILTTRSYPQLNKIFFEYKDLLQKDIVQTIKDRFSGSLKHGFLAIAKSTIKRSDYFADQLKTAISGIGTNNKQLTRIIVGRSEIDLSEIKKSFEKIYSTSLAEKIAGDTSGEYRNLLLALVRK